MKYYEVVIDGKVVGSRKSKNEYKFAIVERIRGDIEVIAYSKTKENAIKRAKQQINYRNDINSSYYPQAIIQVVEIQSKTAFEPSNVEW